jgi:hypothetical protein
MSQISDRSGALVLSTSNADFDSAAAAIADERLSDVLSLVHREGFGHTAQVVRPERGRTADRLRRAGLDTAAIARLAEQNRPIVLIFAPERVEAADVILRRGGAASVERYAQCAGTQSTVIGFDPAVLQPRRSHRRSGTAQGS